MSYVVRRFPSNSLKSRNSGSLKDGTYIRVITAEDDGSFKFWDMEGKLLYTDETLKGVGFFPQSINIETSSFTGTAILIVAGFFEGSSGGETIVISTDYKIAPPIWYGELLTMAGTETIGDEHGEGVMSLETHEWPEGQDLDWDKEKPDGQ
jgi:hypothetical protein